MLLVLMEQNTWNNLTTQQAGQEWSRHQAAHSTIDHSCAVLVGGTTGNGKSSLIKAMTGNADIKANGGTQSVTQNNGYYRSQNVLWIDTKGGLDINQESDVIFKDIKKECFQHGVNKIKIIWCVNSETRNNSEYDTQARS